MKTNVIKNNVANFVTFIRILCGIGLAICPTFGVWFYVLYAVGGISDVLDGFLARALKTASAFGSRLDTVADFIFFAAVLIKTFLAVTFPLWLIIWVICIALIKCTTVLCGMIKTKKLFAEHTVFNKIAGILLYAVPFYVSLIRTLPVKITLGITAGVATFAAIHEFTVIIKKLHTKPNAENN